MTTTQTGPRPLVRRESLGRVEAVASGTLSGTMTTAELDLVDQQLDLGEASDSGIDIVSISGVLHTPVVPCRPQLKIVNPDCPVRYIPIHIW